jgi:aspartate kinase
MTENITLKFGGSSMCLDGFNTILTQLQKYSVINVFLVVSAIKNTTNNLFKIVNFEKNAFDDIIKDHNYILNQLNIKSTLFDETLEQLKNDIFAFIQDPNINIIQQKIKIISYGEILSSIMLFEFLKIKNINVKLINARNIIRAQKNHTNIDPHNLNLKGAFYCDSSRMSFMVEPNYNVYLTQGYIASTSDDKYCILSRSGSDTSASLIASAMKSIRLEIWTDVNGMYTADPRLVNSAQLIENIDYDVCQEVSASGSYVLHPYCIRPCQEKGVPIYVKNTFFPNETKCTVCSKHKNESKDNIYAISIKKNISVFKVESVDMWEGDGFVSDIFTVFAKYNTGVDIITTSQFNITTTTAEKSEQKIKDVHKELSQKYDVELIENCSIISITADNIMNNKKIHDVLPIINEICEDKIYINHYSSNNLTLSVVVHNDVNLTLVKVLHKILIEKEQKDKE